MFSRYSQLRYTYATETRNNVIAAQQNISSIQRYLINISFPYFPFFLKMKLVFQKPPASLHLCHGDEKQSDCRTAEYQQYPVILIQYHFPLLSFLFEKLKLVLQEPPASLHLRYGEEKQSDCRPAEYQQYTAIIVEHRFPLLHFLFENETKCFPETPSFATPMPRRRETI